MPSRLATVMAAGALLALCGTSAPVAAQALRAVAPPESPGHVTTAASRKIVSRLRALVAALYYRLKARRGTKKAIVAVQHAMLVALWHMLTHRVPHRDLGRDYFDRRNETRIRRHHVRRLQQLGYQVLLVQEAAA